MSQSNEELAKAVWNALPSPGVMQTPAQRALTELMARLRRAEKAGARVRAYVRCDVNGEPSTRGWFKDCNCEPCSAVRAALNEKESGE